MHHNDHGIEEFEKGLYPKIEHLDEIDKDTIYFDGINKIEGEITKIIDKHPNSRVVVFIDDLDRCSPKKALEVFESIKVFLDLKGFIYILGLSQETIDKIITGEYEKSGIKGEHYIRKIIQIPIIVPYWSTSDLEQLIEQVLSKKLDAEYARIITENKGMITSAVELNPREIKRFVNNFHCFI